MKKTLSVILTVCITVLATIAVFSADDTMPGITENTVSGSGVSSGGIGCGGGGGGSSSGGSASKPAKLPTVSFTANYESDNSRFEVITEINSDGCAQDAEVMVAAYKNNALQKLLFSIKLNSDSVYDKKITRYSIVQESDNPTDFSFKCFTLGENLRPVLPVYTVTGRQAMENSGEYSVKLRGIVTANSTTDINSPSITDSGAEAPFVKVRLNEILTRDFTDFKIPSEQTFSAGKTDAEGYLGMAVTMEVAKDEDGTYKVISICEDTNVNKVVSFSPNCFEEVVSYPDLSASGKLKYYSDINAENATTAKLSPSLSVVYNYTGGQELSQILSGSNKNGIVACNGCCDFSGEITLIDNDGTGDYDVVFVKLASTAVTAKTSSDGTVFLKQAVSLPDGSHLSGLDTETPEQRIDIMRNGKKISSADLSEWDVLSVYAAKDDAGYMRAEVITNKTVGVIKGDFDSDTSLGGKGYIINGTEYDVVQGAYGCYGLSIGDGGTFYIDAYGKIAAFDEDSALAAGVSNNYGYVFKAIVDNDSIDDNTVTLQLVTANGVEVFDLAASVKFKARNVDKTLKPADARYQADKEAAATAFFGQALKGQVIKYAKNSNNKINNITLADYNDKFELGGANITGTFDADNNKVGGTYIDDDAILFFIDTSDVDKCSVGKVTDLEDETVYTLLKVYADRKAENNNIIVVLGGLDNIGVKSNVAVIKRVIKSENDDGDEIYILTYIQDGKEAIADTVAVNDIRTSLTPLTEGDVVKLKINSKGKINNIQFVWDFKDGVRRGAEKLTAGGFVRNGDEVFDGGAVYAYKSLSQEVTFKDGKSYKLSNAANIYVIDSTGRKVTADNGSVSSYNYFEDLYEAKRKVEIRVDGDLATTVNPGKVDEFAAYTDYVYVRQYDSVVKDVVIVKGPNNVRTKITSTAVDATFKVTFDANGGLNAPAAQTVKKGEKAAKPVAPTPPTGKTFKFWSVGGVTEYNFDTAVTADITLKAVYEDAAPTT